MSRSVLAPFLLLSSLLAAAPAAAGEGFEAGKPCPDFELFDVRGAPVRLSSFRGKVVLLQLFASW
jgi:cytochrome oxidase Cu insertion factor (SCO1/SenC/PrrC family)